MLDIEQDKLIDPDALDVEWIEQANLFYKYSDALNEAMEKKNDLKLKIEYAKEKLDELKAALDLSIRKNPEEFGLSKVTESSINSAILIHKEYKNALESLYDVKKEFNEAQSATNKLFSCVSTMEQKKSALENLGKLLAQQYFSSPDSPRNLKYEHHNRTSKIKQEAKRKIKSRRRRDE